MRAGEDQIGRRVENHVLHPRRQIEQRLREARHLPRVVVQVVVDVIVADEVEHQLADRVHGREHEWTAMLADPCFPRHELVVDGNHLGVRHHVLDGRVVVRPLDQPLDLLADDAGRLQRLRRA